MSSLHRDDALEAILFECLERIEREGLAALDAVCAAHPTHAAALRDSVAALRGAGLLTTPEEGGVGADFPERLGEFRLIRRIGGGGMGVVFLAEQPSLGRDVALKLIRPDQLFFTNARERFRREIEAIARLAHPGIVQVHAVGEDKGIPYYAMEHVQGVSLAYVVAAFAGRRPESLSGRDLEALLAGRSAKRDSDAAEARGLFEGAWAQAVARLGLHVSRAIEHAHDRGVLHRDLKPSNVMLTRSGRVVVLDFGLASLLGAARITRTGSQLGSLPYMAPEQLRGDVDAIGVGTDVYAVGVTLYELLTLRPAFDDDTDTEQLRRKVIEGRFPRPKELYAGLPRDLGVIVERALAAEPAHRYESAKALADDLAAFLDLRAIAARPPSALERAGRWVRRNPARAAASALAVVVFAGGPLGFAWQQYRANTRIREVNTELADALEDVNRTGAEREEQRAAALRNLDRAVRVVDTMLTRVGQESLRDIPQMTAVRRSLLEDALKFYEEFLAERQGDEDLRRQVALARMRVASVRAMMGETADVDRDLSIVIDELAPLAASAGADPALFPILARALGTRSEARARLGRVDDARADVLLAIQTLERVPPDREDAQHYLELAGHHDKLYDVALRGGDARGALESAERAVELSRRGLTVDPEYALLELGLGRQLDHVGTALLRLGKLEESLARMREAVGALERYHVARPADTQGREKLMAANINAANTLSAMQRLDEAEVHTAAAAKLGEALVREFPDVHSYRGGYALALNQSCYYAFRRGDLETAARVLEAALAQQEVIVSGRPSDIGLRAEMAGAYGNLSVVQLERGELEPSLTSADRGLGSLQVALERVPNQGQWLDLRRSLHFNRGRTLIALGRWRDASEAARSIDPDGKVQHHEFRAQLLERASRLAAGDEALPAAERATMAGALRAEAVAELARGAEVGPQDWSSLADPDEFASLRDDPAFQALVAGGK